MMITKMLTHLPTKGNKVTMGMGGGFASRGS